MNKVAAIFLVMLTTEGLESDKKETIFVIITSQIVEK